MSILISILVFVLVIFLISKFKGIKFGAEPSDNTSRPDAGAKPTTEKDNDKLIVVSNVNRDDIELALTRFCNTYNKADYAALPRLSNVSPDTFAITFPYDIDFVTFCFAINFIKYPTDIKWNAKVTAWTTANSGEAWIADSSVGKRIMLFIPDDDKEYDNVFFTTADNTGYKLDFAARKAKPPLNIPKMQFAESSVDLDSLKQLQFKDIE
ncbi:hypothetical protein [Mucilaginibacter sp. NFX135]|uniref:hypothetical protein n=1 Tax=Mucilaginibacter sp. NFX135 TaxID=3402687 RepID=UPI003AFAB006